MRWRFVVTNDLLYLLFNPYLCQMKNYPLKSYRRLVRMCWVVIYLTLLFQFIPQTSLMIAILYPALVLSACYLPTTYLSRNLLRKALRTKQIYTFTLQFIGISVICGAFFFIGSMFFYLLEIKQILPRSDLFMVDQPIYYAPVFLTAGILINLILCGVRFFEENLKFQKQLYEAELHTLKAQINPHFTFNVLNHIHYHVENKSDLASVLLLKYSEVLRYQLYSTRNEKVPLNSEIQFLKDYIEIEKIRWEDKIKIRMQWIKYSTNLSIVPLLLITPVENAFKHVSRMPEKKGYIGIFLEQKANQLYLQVENSRESDLFNDNSRSGLGLHNLKKRLDLCYYNKYKLSIDDTGLVYKFTLIIELQA